MSDQNNTKSSQNNLQKLSDKEAAILSIKQKYPNLPNDQIGKKAVDLGMLKNHRSIQPMISRSACLKAEFNKVAERNNEFVERKIAPLALEIHEKALKKAKKDKDYQSVKDFVVPITKSVMNRQVDAEPSISISESTVNILVQGAMQRDDNRKHG